MNSEEIDLKELLSIFWDKKGIIVFILIISIFAGFIYTMYYKDPKYTASATLILAQKDAGETAVTQTDVTLNDKLISTYKELAKSNTVVREVINNLSLTKTSESKLKSSINVTALKDTQIIKISVTDPEPDKAQRIANELSEVFVKKIAEIYKIDNISIVDKAELPTLPSNINHKKDIAIFAAAGLVVAIGIITLIHLLDTTVKNSADVEKATDLLVLAEIPECNFEGKKLI